MGLLLHSSNSTQTQIGPATLPTSGAVVIPGKGNDMAEPTWKLGARRQRTYNSDGVSRTAAMRMLGAVVYAARLADGTIKIGWTERFDLRLHWLKHHVEQDVELLAFRPSSYEDEQGLHASLTDHRATGDNYALTREYYDPAPEVLAVVNEMRAGLNMPPVAA